MRRIYGLGRDRWSVSAHKKLLKQVRWWIKSRSSELRVGWWPRHRLRVGFEPEWLRIFAYAYIPLVSSRRPPSDVCYATQTTKYGGTNAASDAGWSRTWRPEPSAKPNTKGTPQGSRHTPPKHQGGPWRRGRKHPQTRTTIERDRTIQVERDGLGRTIN